MRPPEIHVGVPVEVKDDEVEQLFMLAWRMQSVAESQEEGWLLEYIKCHKESWKVIRTIFGRSHMLPFRNGSGN